MTLSIITCQALRLGTELLSMSGELSLLYSLSVALDSIPSCIRVLSYVSLTNENSAASSLPLEDHIIM